MGFRGQPRNVGCPEGMNPPEERLTVPGSGFGVHGKPDPREISPIPFDRDYNRDPNIKALTRRGFMNQGFTLWNHKMVVSQNRGTPI